MENKKFNPEIEQTTFINIDDQPFDIYINKNLVRHTEPNESHTIVYYVAQVGAKHLVDRILQKQGIKDTLRDTPLRKDLFARILPDIAKEIKVEPLSPEQRQAEFEKLMKEQTEKFSAENKKRDEEVAKLREEIEALKAEKPKKPKVVKE